ncbi:MAG TPA: HAMP domain-containing sensor histidine kinase [Bacteroidota bacterium]|nr:HAMP domain-containing sensor histidine kinase [Bacteroidota bacterium]
MAIRHSLRFRVLVGSIILLLMLFGVYSLVTVTYYGDRMTQQVIESANRMSDVVRQSTHYGMLLNRREDVHEIITMIGTEPGVEGIRIYNKRGEIMFSTDKREEQAVVDMQAEACYACHEKEKPLSSLSPGNRTRIYFSPAGHRVLGVITPIRNAPSCSSGSCHAHPPERTVLGVLDVRLSLADTDAAIAEAEQTVIFIAVGMILLVASVSVWYLSATVIRPVKILMNGAREVSGGNLNHHIDIRSKDELGRLADAFNVMTGSLRDEKEQNRIWADTLQEKVTQKTAELTEIHKRILHVEKMASLGKLAATVAHELNNPLEAILTYARLIGRRIRTDPSAAETQKPTLEDIDLIGRETQRCGTIVKNLLLFSKKQVSEFALVPVGRIVEKAGEIVLHHFEISSVRLDVVVADENAMLMCDEGQIQQALVALFVNAVEAMPRGGAITVRVEPLPDNDELSITVSDTGTGIAPGDLHHLFEPFFTTKKDGKGVGLGLSVVYGIVERHGGRITVSSEPGSGTAFHIVLPRVPTPVGPSRHPETQTAGAP